MINYIIQVILFQTLFLAVYDFFLAKETFFTKNRWYLLVTAIGSFLIPFINFPTFQRAIPKEISIVLPEIVLSPQSVIEQTTVYQSFNYGMLIFWIGLSFFSLIFGYRLYRLILLMVKNSIEKRENYYLITIPNSKKAFSFFNYVFLGSNVDELEKDKIISHELIHCKQKHSIDLLIFESLKIVMWFNPLVYVYQKRVATVHEYISDAIVVKSVEKKQYINNLVNQLFDVEQISFVNQFYKSSLIKKRIKMMTREKSKQIKQVKYLLLIPILLSMIFYTSCLSSNTANRIAIENQILKDSIEVLKKRDSIRQKLIQSMGNKPTLKSLKNLGVLGDKEKDVPFTVIDKVPTFPGCKGTKAELKACFNKKIQKHFATNFNSNLPKKLKLSPGKKRLIMLFKVDKEGNIVDVRAKAPHPGLKEELVRIVKMLPKMLPGEQNGKPVGVKYTMPMRIDVVE